MQLVLLNETGSPGAVSIWLKPSVVGYRDDRTTPPFPGEAMTAQKTTSPDNRSSFAQIHLAVLSKKIVLFGEIVSNPSEFKTPNDHCFFQTFFLRGASGASPH